MSIFRVGDRVWDIRYGWGEVKAINNNGNDDFPVKVRFDDSSGSVTYTHEGVYSYNLSRSLFFEELIIPETALKRKEWRAEIKRRYYFITSTGRIEPEIEGGDTVDDDRARVGNYFKSEEDAKESAIYKLMWERSN